jgi:hypothetical protein
MLDFSVIKWKFNCFCAVFGIMVGSLVSGEPITVSNAAVNGIFILFLCALLDIFIDYRRRNRKK